MQNLVVRVGDFAEGPLTPVTPDLCRRAREALGWTPEQLASAAGLSWRTVERFENGTRTPRPGTLIALRKALRNAGAFAPVGRGTAVARA